MPYQNAMAPNAPFRWRSQALKKELGKSQAVTGIVAPQSAKLLAEGETLIRRADRLLCESWNERM
jgi:hypothetical protein